MCYMSESRIIIKKENHALYGQSGILYERGIKYLYICLVCSWNLTYIMQKNRTGTTYTCFTDEVNADTIKKKEASPV